MRPTTARDDETMVNLALFRRYRFYQLFDPDGPTVLRYNVHRCAMVAYIAVVLAVNAFSALSFATGDADAADTIDRMLAMFVYCVNGISFVKMAVFLRRADLVWDLFGFARLDFVHPGSLCRGHVAVLLAHRDRSVRLTDFLLNYTAGVFVTWMAVPLAYNAFAGADDDDPAEAAGAAEAADATTGPRRRQNVFNLTYPVTAAAFNRHFVAFYLMEAAMGSFLLYGSTLVDVFFISVCIAFIAHYEALGAAFAGIGHDGQGTAAAPTTTGQHYRDRARSGYGYKNNSLEAHRDLKSTLYDQILVYKKLKSFYSVVWIIVVSLIIVNSIALIILSYSIIVVFMSSESFTIYRLIKLPTAYVIFALQIFLYCYLFDILNDKKQSVSFSMYCCHWTKMDLKFKKLILMAMRVNNANQLMIKTSPTKIVNMHLFSNVMSTTYNIVSVMINRTTKNTNS